MNGSPDRRLGLVSTVTELALLPYRLYKYRPLRGNWFARYLRAAKSRVPVPADGPIDILVCIADHFEPGSTHGSAAAVEAVQEWCKDYAAHVNDIRDSNGRKPQHTWFYRAEYSNLGCIHELSKYCFSDYGEIEFHLHHGYDNQESFRNKLEEGLDFFNQHGAMLTVEASPKRRFSYVAGNWSLDNGSQDDSKSGCNTELVALRDAGCYCDFTFPALGSKAQPRTTNSIYYVTDDPGPKSYDSGTPVTVGGIESGDLMLIQGPCGFDIRNIAFEDGSLESQSPPNRRRARNWLSQGIHVAGRPEWIFVKLHCHGLQSKSLWRGPQIRAMFQWMESDWNHGRYRLHFVNTREAYNVVKAAERGEVGSPSQYFDYVIPAPANRRIYCSSPWKLTEYSETDVQILVNSDAHAELRVAGLDCDKIEGVLRKVELKRAGGRFVEIRVQANSPVTVRRRDDCNEIQVGVWQKTEHVACMAEAAIHAEVTHDNRGGASPANW